ncbi:aldehyde dehydrogenase family protein [Bradyrhizobium tunisiense]|uniref:aldehyde dehydrogenase family protein n=1 Tax=Bradyrhizobium tunisiense TaxID=3278709 RepID=UPI0035DD1C1F
MPEDSSAVQQPVDDVEQAIARANALPYGLAGYAFTRSAAIANRIAGELEVGVIGINQMVVTIPETPFGGIGDSGWGREGGIEHSGPRRASCSRDDERVRSSGYGRSFPSGALS